MTVPRSLLPAVLLAVVLPVGLAGCNFNFSTGSMKIERAKVEKMLMDSLTLKFEGLLRSVSCPNDLEAKVGVTTRCTITEDDGSTIGVVATVTSVDKGKGSFKLSYKVDDKIILDPTGSSTDASGNS